MLLVSRKLGEKLYIGDNICITVVDIERGKIRLGIEAPRDMSIYRQELLPLDKPEDPKEGTARQHIDLCGAPLRKAIAMSEEGCQVTEDDGEPD